jgi:hypothetical protein
VNEEQGMSKNFFSSELGGLLLPLSVLIVAAAAFSAYVIWDTSRDAKREEDHKRVLSGIKSEIKQTKDELRQAQADLANAKDELTTALAEKKKLQAVAAELSKFKGRIPKEPPRIVTKRKFAETDFDETLKRASFKTPEIEAQLMTEKPVILLEEDVEAPPAPVPVERATGLNAGGKYERDAREMAASQALGKAIAYEYNHPNAKKEDIAAKYREVIGKYPDTTASKEAAKILKEIQNRSK